MRNPRWLYSGGKVTAEERASDDVRAVGDLPRRASDWQVLAITAAAITFSLAIIAFIFWVLQAPRVRTH